MSDLIEKKHPRRCVHAIAVAGQGAECGVVTEKAQHQGVALSEIRVDRRSSVQRSGMHDYNVSRLSSPGENVIGLRVFFPLRLDVGKPRQSGSTMQRRGGVVRIGKVSAVVLDAPM